MNLDMPIFSPLQRKHHGLAISFANVLVARPAKLKITWEIEWELHQQSAPETNYKASNAGRAHKALLVPLILPKRYSNPRLAHAACLSGVH
jgi:hypothetical protein